jgi:hypothetical protein
MVGASPSAAARSLASQLAPIHHARELTHLSLSFGGERIKALASARKKLNDYNVSLIGSSTSVYAGRMSGFAGAVKDYQDALLKYRKVIKTPGAARELAKRNVLSTYQKMQLKFGHEVNVVTSPLKARKGTPITSVERAVNIARSSRTATKLNVSSHVEAHNLIKFAKHAKYLGNGLAVIDFADRVGRIQNAYKAGDNWEREMFIESSSFAVSAVAGSLAVDAGLALLMVATPVGWVGLLIGGLVVAGAAAGTAMTANNLTKENAGGIYDSIMRWIGGKI